MTTDDFNEKWSNNLEEGHYGLDIGYNSVIKYLDEEFEKEFSVNPKFTYSQIKIKFGYSRVYVNNCDKSEIWENKINELIRDN